MREVQSILKREARKLLRARALTLAATGLAGAAFACALLQLHWWGLAHGYWKITAAILVTGGIAGCVAAMRLGWPAVLGRLGLGLSYKAIASVCHASALFMVMLGAGIAVMPYWDSIPQWMLPVICLPAGAMISAALAGLAGVTPRQAAFVIDGRFHLKERVTTAAELIEQGRADEAWGRCVCQQALVAMEQAGAASHRAAVGGPMFAIAGLAVLLCATMTFLPGPAEPAGPALAATVADALPTMPADQRQRLADALRAAAEKAKEMPAVEANLTRAAAAADKADPETMRKALELLESGGLELRRVIPPDIQSATGGKETLASGSNPKSATNPAVNTATQPAGPELAGGAIDYVHVMNPEYGEVQAASKAGGNAASAVPWAQAWERARSRAMQELNSGSVPAAYRGLVRDFFSDGQKQ